MSELNNLVKLLNQYPTLKIEISGHTDDVGNEEYNQKLSVDRAQAVVNYLISKGISSSRLSFIGFGFTKPIADNTTEEGRKLNRRSEFKIISK
jgi:outer membrane protein OmpA-like peptidoglycan-associated protein